LQLRRKTKFAFYTVIFYGQSIISTIKASESSEKDAVWTPTNVQFLYPHRNGRYYVRTFAGGKEKWASMKTRLLTVAKNRMKDHVDASERLKASGEAQVAAGSLSFGNALETYRKRLENADIRPNTKAFREAGIKLVLRSWTGIEKSNVRKITSRSVEEWLREFWTTAKPYVPNNAKSAARSSTGASVTTIKCALDALRHILDVRSKEGTCTQIQQGILRSQLLPAAYSNRLVERRRSGETLSFRQRNTSRLLWKRSANPELGNAAQQPISSSSLPSAGHAKPKPPMSSGAMRNSSGATSICE